MSNATVKVEHEDLDVGEPLFEELDVSDKTAEAINTLTDEALAFAERVFGSHKNFVAALEANDEGALRLVQCLHIATSFDDRTQDFQDALDGATAALRRLVDHDLWLLAGELSRVAEDALAEFEAWGHSKTTVANIVAEALKEMDRFDDEGGSRAERLKEARLDGYAGAVRAALQTDGGKSARKAERV